LMAGRITKRKRVLVSEAVHPEYRRVIQTYTDPDQQEIIMVPYLKEEGRTDTEALFDLLEGEVGAVVVQSPNFFGVIEDLYPIAEKAHENGSLMIVGFSEAIAYGILRPPGGPYLGIFTTRGRLLRNMPGRLVGETIDLEGKRGFVLTLATREQHIRRERATSNICTNEGLCALMATVFLSCLGKEGLRELAIMNLSKKEYAKKLSSQIPHCQLTFSSPTFNEFVLKIGGKSEKVLEKLKEKRILGGLSLSKFFPALPHDLLITVTEMNTKKEIDRWAEALEDALKT
jgi:glycine dehydrogenase subunit 1